MNYRIVKHILECIKNQLCLDSFAACSTDGAGEAVGKSQLCLHSPVEEAAPHTVVFFLYLSFI